jgi:predicted MFS family arabinose efflux permease
VLDQSRHGARLSTPEQDGISVARRVAGVLLRSFVIGLTAFLTVVDMFATQAILPSLTRAYGVTPAAMGFAVKASTISLALLAIPTTLLAVAPDLTTFTILRIIQGLCMASAFSLTLA